MFFSLRRGATAILLAAIAGLSACSPAPQGVAVHDPYEPMNRRVHAFNKGIDRAVSGASGGGGASVPEDISEVVSNFADNVSLPGMVVNGVLQGNFRDASTNTLRFLINTTLGLVGLADPATQMGLEEQDTDFGETLAVWGVPEGAYLELPVLGPSTERDLAGRVVDAVIDPLKHVGTEPQRRLGTVSKLADKALSRARFGDTVDSVLHESADSYAQTRLVYLQHRRYELGQEAPATAETEIDPYALPPGFE